MLADVEADDPQGGDHFTAFARVVFGSKATAEDLSSGKVHEKDESGLNKEIDDGQLIHFLAQVGFPAERL